MKHVLHLLLVLALLFGVSAGAVRLGDRELFVSPPDAVGEGLVRELVTKRWDRAREYLTEPAGVSQQTLEALAERLGDPTTIDVETIARDEKDALVRVRGASAHGSKTMSLELTFDREWKVVLRDVEFLGVPRSSSGGLETPLRGTRGTEEPRT